MDLRLANLFLLVGALEPFGLVGKKINIQALLKENNPPSLDNGGCGENDKKISWW